MTILSYCSFSVLNPSKASMIPMIQKRTVTFVSLQPSSSKWWWIGALKKIRFPFVALK